jgi:hypothetical protein
MPDMDGATIVDIFCTGRKLSIYTRNAAGIQALAKFRVDDSTLCLRIGNVLFPGLDVHQALGLPID